MVFQRATIVAIDRDRPDTIAALDRIPGLGPARIARFGADLIAIVNRYGGSRSSDADPDPVVRDLFSQLSQD